MFKFMNSEKNTGRFAKVYGCPGQGPRTVGPLRVFWPLIPFCFASGWLLRAAVPVPQISTSTSGLLFVLLAVALAVFTVWSAQRLRSFLKGAEGEETVARILSFLPTSYTVFNDLQLSSGGQASDHIVVAPAGIFVIETKNWSGAITFQDGQVFCDGHTPSRSPLKQVKKATVELVSQLSAAGCPSVPVYPVVCFVGNRPHDSVVNVGGVRICTDEDFPALFENTLETPVPAGTLGMITSELTRCIDEKH